jgi:putative PIN family toxin of toxin-antitoxin system
MRVLVDTNVLVSLLLKPSEGGPVRSLFYAFVAGRFALLLPEWLVNELTTTVKNKPRLSKRISVEQLNRFTTSLVFLAEKVDKIEPPVPAVTRDPEDDYVLAYALVGRADYLVTGDKDLLALSGQIPGLDIVTPAQFVEIQETNDLSS